MTALFALAVEGLQAAIFGFSHLLGGSLPGGILATTVLLRLALLPLTVRLARRARARGRALKALRPALDRIRRRYADEPHLLADRTLALYRARGLSPVDWAAAGGALVQLPLLAGFFRAVRGVLPALEGRAFLWIRDLARPSPVLTLLTSAVVLAATTVGGAGVETQPGWMRWVPAAGTLVALLFVSSGFGLYLLGSAGVSLLQAAVVGRGEPDGG